MMPAEVRRVKKRATNRESARRMRALRRGEWSELAGEVAALRAENAALRAALSVFHDVFRTSKISTEAWSVHIQPFFCALTSRREGARGSGEGEEEEEEEEHGVGGAQIPW